MEYEQNLIFIRQKKPKNNNLTCTVIELSYSTGTGGLMGFNHKKSVTYRIAQTAKAHRARSNTHLNRIGLHPGQEVVLKALFEKDGQSMTELARALSVQPPTVTKTITRLAAQNLVERRASPTDKRLSRVYMTDDGRERIGLIDKAWKRLEKEAVAGLEIKDRKRLRKLLRQVEKSLATSDAALAPDDLDAEIDDDKKS